MSNQSEHVIIDPQDVELSSHLEWVTNRCEELAAAEGKNFWRLPITEQHEIYATAFMDHTRILHDA